MDKMWAYMIQLGSNMWRKKGAKNHPSMEACYHETMYTEREVWNKVTEFLPQAGFNTLLIDVGEGVELDSHPELAIPGSWEKAEVKEEIQRLRELGLTPIPKLNFSAGHNAWLQDYAYMIGTDTYYKVTEEILEETIELFETPEFFHLGMDEETTSQAEFNPITVVRSPFKFVEDAQKLFKVCDRKGVRPWIWLDPAGLQIFGGEEGFSHNVPKNALISNWFYYDFTHAKHKDWIEIYKKIGEWGYDQIPTCSTWNNTMNCYQTMEYCKNQVNPDSIKGYLSAPWLFTTQKSQYGLMDGAWVFYDAKKEHYPEECKKETGEGCIKN